MKKIMSLKSWALKTIFRVKTIPNYRRIIKKVVIKYYLYFILIERKALEWVCHDGQVTV
jgi:hypothetical protein